MNYFIYALMTLALFLVYINYFTHKRLIHKLKPVFFRILENKSYMDTLNNSHPEIEQMCDTFSEVIEVNEFRRYLRQGRVIFVITDFFIILLIFLSLFFISYFLEFHPFEKFEISELLTPGTIIFSSLSMLATLLIIFLKTLLYDDIISECTKNDKKDNIVYH